MNAVDVQAASPAPRSAWRRLALAHAWLAGSMVVWRVIEGMPRTSSITSGTFAASPAGRALAMITVLGAVVALPAVLALTWRLRRDVRSLALLVALIGALWQRTRVDALDISYLAFVVVAVSLVTSLRQPHAEPGC